MKKILILILLTSAVCCAQRTNRKTYYGSVGVGMSFPNADGINNIINFYNKTNPNIVQPMNTITKMVGFNFLFGVNFNKEKSFGNVEMGFYFGYSGRKTSQTLEGGALRTENILIKYPLLNLGGQYFLKVSPFFDIGAGCSFNLGSYNILYRKYISAAAAPSYVNVNNDNLLSDFGISPVGFFNFHLTKSITASVRPYYYYMISSQDLTGMNFLFNGNSNTGNNSNAHYSGPGINLNFLFQIN